MSKFVDKLAKLSQTSGPSIGFRRSPTTQSAGMLLAAEIPGNKVSLSKGAVAAGVDALVVRVDSLTGETGALKDAAKLAGETVWGVHINKMVPDDATALRDLGCDFLIVDALAAPAAILSEKDLGKILRVDAQWADSMIRTLDQVALDAVLLDADEVGIPGLNLHQLLLCQRVASLARKPLLVGVAQGLDGAGLQSLHSIGVESVLYRYGTDASAGQLEKLKKAIDALPAFRGRGKGIAMLPRVEAASPVESEEEEEEEDDD